MALRVGKIILAAGKDTQDIMRLSQRACVLCCFGEIKRALRQIESLLYLAVMMGAAAPISINARAGIRSAVFAERSQSSLEVAFGQFSIAAPLVDSTKLMFDACQRTCVREGSRSFITAQGGAVFAQKRIQVANNLVQCGRLRMAQSQCSIKVCQCLSIGIEAAGVLACQLVILCGGCVVSGKAEMS